MLMAAAKESLAEAKFSAENGVWSLVIRRSQEAVELALSGLLAFLGIHFPKNHDQAPLLFRVLRSQGLTVDDEARVVEMISIDLSRKRGPALHQEEGYDEETATVAVNDAGYVLNIVMELRKQVEERLRGEG